MKFFGKMFCTTQGFLLKLKHGKKKKCDYTLKEVLMLIVLLVLWLMLVLLLPSHILLYNNDIFLSQFLQVKPNFYFEGLPLRPLKGQFTQEWKLSFTHARVVPNLCFFHLLNTKDDICMNVGKQTSSHWLPQYLFFSNYGSQWLPSTAWLPTFFFCAEQRCTDLLLLCSSKFLHYSNVQFFGAAVVVQSLGCYAFRHTVFLITWTVRRLWSDTCVSV